VAGEPGAERRGLVRVVLAELIDWVSYGLTGTRFSSAWAWRGEYALVRRPGWPVEVELAERPRAHRYQRHSLRAIRKPDLYAWLQSLDVNSHRQNLPGTFTQTSPQHRAAPQK
jgi:hypothetical protein